MWNWTTSIVTTRRGGGQRYGKLFPISHNLHYTGNRAILGAKTASEANSRLVVKLGDPIYYMPFSFCL